MKTALKGKTLYLRALEPNDLDLLYTWENDSTIWHLSSTATPYSKHLLKQFIESDNDIYTNKQLRLVICLHDHSAIGTIDLFDFHPQHQRAGLGILIADETRRGKGHGQEALQLVIDYCFEFLLLHQVYCNVLVDNLASVRLFEKNGFKIVGTKKEWIKIGQEWSDEYLLQLNSRNWRKI
jgi:diamine N-acetyltransferase